MKGLNKCFLWSILFFCAEGVKAQSQIFVFDEVQKTPIPYANVFKAEKGSFKGTTSDENGVATIDFPFQKLHVSHVNYRQKVLTELPDTIFLTPKENVLTEVVVKDVEPLWIRPFLQKFIAKKDKVYRSVAKTFDYSYQTRNVSDSSGYWFENSGRMRFPASSEKTIYRIKPSKGYIHFKDETAGCDFANMKRMVYHDFVAELDRKFVKHHTFRVNDAFLNENKNIVQLYFKSLKYGHEDKGYIEIDTAKCAILSVSRNTGLGYNVAHNTNGVTRATINLLTGWKYSKWIVSQEAKYHAVDGTYYPSIYRYKAYILAKWKKVKRGGHKLDSSEAEIVFNPADQQDETGFLELPEPWYMRIVLGKKERLAEERLQNIPKEHIIY